MKTNQEIFVAVLEYEIYSSWWAGWFPRFEGLSARYYIWKTSRKYNRFMRLKKMTEHIKAA